LVDEGADAICDAVISELHHGDKWHDDVVLLVVRNTTQPSNIYDVHHPSEPLELSRIRAAVREWLVSRGLDEPVIDDVVIAIGEAASNVVRHAYGDRSSGDMRVQLAIVDGSVDVTVSDQGSWRVPEPAHKGMGLGIIESIADGVDLTQGPDGTTLRFRIALDPSLTARPVPTT
jgi:anti-sigma regulatory factor (Ser/Thr protein kinase)